jgi:hypothetical protein
MKGGGVERGVVMRANYGSYGYRCLSFFYMHLPGERAAPVAREPRAAACESTNCSK